MGNLGTTWSAERRALHDRRFGISPERILSRVEFDTNGGCWLWAGSITPSTGYGSISINHRGEGAHRLSWKVFRGPIPDGLHVCHRCDVRPCVNPDHLFLGTPQENVDDMWSKGRHWVRRGNDHPCAKLTAADIPTILRRLADGQSCRSIGDDYGVDQCAINAIRRGRSWRSVTHGAQWGVSFSGEADGQYPAAAA